MAPLALSAQGPRAFPPEAPSSLAAANPAMRAFAGIVRPASAPAPAPPLAIPAAPAPKPAENGGPNLSEAPSEDRPSVNGQDQREAESGAPPKDVGSEAAAEKDAEFAAESDFEIDFGALVGSVPAPQTNGPAPSLPAAQAAGTGRGFDQIQFGDLAPLPEAGQSAAPRARRSPPVVALGWGLLALVLAILAGLFLIAPRVVASALPGATCLYAALGMQVNSRGLAFEDVHYAWSSDTGQTVLTVEGQIVNITSGSVDVPTLVIALRDAAGKELSQWTTKAQGEQLAAGERIPFSAEIPAPQESVRSLKVRFAAAE
jgi:hypothetical protein